MKKTACWLLILILLVCGCAFALNGANYPGWDGASPAHNGLCGSFGGRDLQLEFDPSADYSSLKDGTLQACFFAFDSDRENYLEMYLQMPGDIAAGDVLSSADGSLSLTSVTLYEVAETFEDIYFAGQFAGYAYPNGSRYEIRIDEAVRTPEALTVRGTVSATLGKFDEKDMPTGETFQLDGAQFHFELPLGGVSATAAPEASAAPQPSAAPAATLPPQLFPILPTATPRPTMDPHPAFTLPPDYRVI